MLTYHEISNFGFNFYRKSSLCHKIFSGKFYVIKSGHIQRHFGFSSKFNLVNFFTWYQFKNTKNCKMGFGTTKFLELYMVEACQKHLMRDQANFVVSPDAKLPIFSVTSCFFHLLDSGHNFKISSTQCAKFFSIWSLNSGDSQTFLMK